MPAEDRDLGLMEVSQVLVCRHKDLFFLRRGIR